MIGWVFGAFLLLMAGIYFTAYNLNYGYPLFSYTALFHHLSVSDRVTDPCHANACRGTQTEDGPAASHCTGDGMADCAWKIPGTDRHFSSSGRDPVFLSADHGTVRKHCFCIYLRGTAWFFSGFGCTCLAVGLFFSSLTESQILAAVGTFAFLLVCYLMDGISGFFPETAGASFFALVVIVLLIGLLIYHTTQNILLPLVIGVIGEGVLAVLYFVKQSMFEGIIQKILNLFNMSSHFSNFTNSILDLTGVVYYLSFIGIMLFSDGSEHSEKTLELGGCRHEHQFKIKKAG